MALAQLCAMLQRNQLAFPEYQYIRAFVVDHKAREGSQLEVNMVKSRLLRLSKIPSPLLTSAADFEEIYLQRFYLWNGHPMCDL